MWKVVLRRLAVALVIVAIPSSSTSAQNADVEAELLFREGKALLKEGKIIEACAKFEASELRAHNINTLVNLADCKERNIELASAWGLFLKAASEARMLGQTTLEKSVRARATLLENKLSYLTVVIAEPSRLEGLTVSRDDETIEPALWNSAVPVDGGTYEITARATGHESWTATVAVATSEGRAVVEIPPLNVSPTLPKQDSGPQVTEAPPPTPEPARPRTSRDGRRLLAYGMGGVGIVALGLGGYAGLRAWSTWAKVETLCPDHRCANQVDFARADGLVGDARTAGNVSTILVGVGVAVTVASVIVWLTTTEGGDSERAQAWQITPTVDRVSSGMVVTGTF